MFRFFVIFSLFLAFCFLFRIWIFTALCLFFIRQSSFGRLSRELHVTNVHKNNAVDDDDEDENNQDAAIVDVAAVAASSFEDASGWVTIKEEGLLLPSLSFRHPCPFLLVRRHLAQSISSKAAIKSLWRFMSICPANCKRWGQQSIKKRPSQRKRPHAQNQAKTLCSTGIAYPQPFCPNGNENGYKKTPLTASRFLRSCSRWRWRSRSLSALVEAPPMGGADEAGLGADWPTQNQVRYRRLFWRKACANSGSSAQTKSTPKDLFHGSDLAIDFFFWDRLLKTPFMIRGLLTETLNTRGQAWS